MKKTVSLVLVAAMLTVFVVMLTGCGLFKSVKLDEVKANLEDAGYTVTVKTGEEYVSEDNDTPFVTAAELNYYLYAEKDGEVIQMFFFVSTDAASDNGTFIHINSATSGQINDVLYFASKQAKKDAKI